MTTVAYIVAEHRARQAATISFPATRTREVIGFTRSGLPIYLLGGAAGDRTIRVRLEAIIGGYRTGMQQASAATAQFGQGVQKVSGVARKHQESFTLMGAAAIGLGASLLAGLGAAAKAAIEFESSFAGVRKTVEATEAEFEALADGFKNLSTQIPISVNELNKIGELGGQLGIAKGSLLEFTETVAILGATTNLSTEEAATSFARLANVMQLPQTEFDKMAGAVVGLGNNFATTEAEIVAMSQRIAAAGKIAGFSTADVLGLATALSSVGINAEAGGSAMSKAIIEVANAVSSGGENLESFARVAGRSADEFVAQWKAKPAEAMTSFITGLRRIREEGGNVFQVLDDLGLSEIRLRNALLSAAEAGDLLTRALHLSSEEFDRGDAHVKEAQKRFETFASRMQLVRNEFELAKIEAGDFVLRGLAPLLETLGGLAQGFSRLSDPIQGTIVSLTGLGGVTLIAGGTLLLLLPRIHQTVDAFKAMRTAGILTASPMTMMGRALAGIAWVTLAVQALQFASALREVRDEAQALTSERIGADWVSAESAEDAKKRIKGIADEIRAAWVASREPQGGKGLTFDGPADSVAEAIRRLEALRDVADTTRRETRTSLKGLFQDVTLGAFGVSEFQEAEASFATLTGSIQRLKDAQLVSGRIIRGDLTATIQTYKELGADELTVISAHTGLIQDAAAQGRDATRVALMLADGNIEAAEAYALTGEAAADSVLGLDESAAAMDEFAQVSERATEIMQEVADHIMGNTPLWGEYAGAADLSVKDITASLSRYVADMAAWADTVGSLVGTVSQITLEALSAMPPAQQAALAKLRTEAPGEFAQLIAAYDAALSTLPGIAERVGEAAASGLRKPGEGAEDSKVKVDELGGAMNSLPNVSRTITVTTIERMVKVRGSSGDAVSGGQVTYHQGGPIRRYHDGGSLLPAFGALASNEVPLIGKVGEFMLSDGAVRYWGKPLLEWMNAQRMHSGGYVQAEDGSWVPPSFYDPKPGYVQAEDGSWVPPSFYSGRSVARTVPPKVVTFGGAGGSRASTGATLSVHDSEVASEIRALGDRIANMESVVQMNTTKVGRAFLQERRSRA